MIGLGLRNRTAEKWRYNRKTYLPYTFRVRADSALADKLEGFKHDRGSVNYLITELLCAYFKVPIPHLCRFDTVVLERFWPTEKADRLDDPVDAILEPVPDTLQKAPSIDENGL